MKLPVTAPPALEPCARPRWDDVYEAQLNLKLKFELVIHHNTNLWKSNVYSTINHFKGKVKCEIILVIRHPNGAEHRVPAPEALLQVLWDSPGRNEPGFFRGTGRAATRHIFLLGS